MKTSEQIGELAAALAKAQGCFENPERNRAVKVDIRDKQTRAVVGSYKFNYTTLDRIIDMIRKPLSENGLSFTQSVSVNEDWAIVTTRIMHESGQWIEDELPVKPDGFGPQQVGSAITYGKRYSLSALLGVASDEDDDGNLGSGNSSEQVGPPKTKSKAKAVAEQHGMKTADQLARSQNYQRAIDKLTAAVQARDVNEVGRIVNLAETACTEGKLTENERNGILNEGKNALKKIQALETQPDMAAA